QEHRVVVEERGDSASSLLGEDTGLETDRAGAECTVVDDCLGGVECGFRHGSPFRKRVPACWGERRLGRWNHAGLRSRLSGATIAGVSRGPLPRTERVVPGLSRQGCFGMELWKRRSLPGK